MTGQQQCAKSYCLLCTDLQKIRSLQLWPNLILQVSSGLILSRPEHWHFSLASHQPLLGRGKGVKGVRAVHQTAISTWLVAQGQQKYREH